MAHVTGPWYWVRYPKTKTIRLMGEKQLIVMDFARWGMQSAQPRFIQISPSGMELMIDAEDIDLDADPNARLIAAAPELLEALVYLVEAIESSMNGEESLHTWQCGAPDHGRCSCDAHPAMDVARAAIGKATGK